jgi:predicted Zn finger-like uncharacterized protein
MEVLCERCHTEYDFDDALVSERGTTVKCTNCGHQFRIYKPRAVAGSPERWVVRTRAGSEQVFTSLRDLQRAITRGLVDRDDTLTREGLPPRRLAQIAELEPFFPKPPMPIVPQIAVPPRERKPTPRGLGSSPFDPGSDTGLDKRPTVPRVHDKPVSAADLDFDDATVPRIEQALDDHRRAPARDLLGDEPGFEPQTVRKPPATDPQPRGPGVPASQVRPPGPVLIREDPRASFTPTPSDVQTSYQAIDDGGVDARVVPVSVPRRSSAVRWVVALVVLGGVGVLASTVGKRYLEAAIQPASSAGPTDSRVAGLLADADKALLDGDLDRAKESLDKASVLAEADPALLVQVARLADIRADVPWLKQKLLPEGADDTARLNQAQLEDRAGQALTASDRALHAAPQDAAAVRVRIDALRLSGDVAGARKLVGRIADRASEPEVAYVLAALEMSEQSPNWATIVSRLRTAAAAERNLGRARSALIYALAQSGDLDGAQVELDTLQKAPRPSALLVDLKTFLARRRAAMGDAGVGEGGTALDTSALPVARGGEGAEPNMAGSYQDLLARAHAARQAGKYDQAEALYRAVLDKHPGDTEALAGLGDVAKAKGDQAGSLSYYEQVAKENPGYIPALLGLADARWDAGDRSGAATLYRQVLDRTGGQGPYAARAKARLAEAAKKAETPGASAVPTETTPAAPPDTTPPPQPTSPGTGTSGPPPGVDTSDLPGWKPE